MKKIILIVEDLLEEIEKAKNAVMAKGFKVVVASNLEKAFQLLDSISVNGVITDLHFPEMEQHTKNDNPCGLAVVTQAIIRQIPVVVCSNINHHFALYLKALFKDLEVIGGKKIPFSMDRKDWEVATNEIEKLI